MTEDQFYALLDAVTIARMHVDDEKELQRQGGNSMYSKTGLNRMLKEVEQAEAVLDIINETCAAL